MRKVFKWIFLTLGIAGSITLFVILMVRFTPRPPVQEIDNAMKMLSRAGSNRAGTYSIRLYTEAKASFDSAMTIWERENKRFIFFRDYDKVKSYAKTAIAKAKQATENSITSSATLKIKLKDKLESIKKTADLIEKQFGRYPFASEVRTRISKGRMLLNEGEVEYRKGQYLSANRKISDSETLLTEVYDNATAEVKEYFKSFPLWKKWVQSSINESRKTNSYSIIIDKFSKKCYVYYAGTVKYEFEAEFGRNWIGNKRRMGDKATPEGFYKISNKYRGKETLYHKALSIDYPNSEDKERFRKEISKGTLPSYAKIGDGIQIHGGGGKGVDWTEGCIAITDSEVDLIFNLIKVGTPVTIVGSMKNFDEVLLD